VTPPVNASTRLTPYQQEFSAKLLREWKPGLSALLAAPAGSGKTFAVAYVIAELTTRREVGRVLVLSKGQGSARQWRYILGRFGVDAVPGDAEAFRLLRDRFTGDLVKWPHGVFVSPASVASIEDVLVLLQGIPWDLVVLDEACDEDALIELMVALEQRAQPPARLVAAVRVGTRELLAAPPSLPSLLVDWGPEVARFRAAEASGEGGSRVRTTVETFYRTDAECELFAAVQASVSQLAPKDGEHLLVAAASSVAALEDAAYRIDVRVGEVGESLTIVIQLLQDLTGDSKLDAALAIVSRLGREQRSVVVFCEMRATMDYLAAAFGEVARPVRSLAPGIDPGGALAALADHRRDGGVLILAGNASDGVSLNYVTAVIHYDLPSASAAFAQREGRYQRFGRTERCDIFLLRDAADAFALESLQLRLVDAHRISGESAEIDISKLLGVPQAGIERA
jgi:hypothetical protein